MSITKAAGSVSSSKASQANHRYTMNNALHINASSTFLPARMSMPSVLRWLRRAMTLILIAANFAIATWIR